MKKLFFVAILGMSALVAHAQQWAGSSTTSYTIYRYGVTKMMPTTTGVPFSEWSPSSFKVYRYNNSDWKWENVSIEWDGIHMTRHLNSPSDYTTIGHGTFTFYTNGDVFPYSNWVKLEFNDQGILSSNGKIITTDSVVAQNLRATNAVKASSADISTISGSTGTFSTNVTAPNIAVNNSSVPTNFKFAVTGKSYFSDFVGIGTTNLTATSGYKLAVDGGILCEEVKVISNVPSADYVFENGYNLRSLNEVEAFVSENKHLPDVPSAKEFKANGYKMGDMDNLLLQKIEELTLYIIEQQKQIDELKSKLNE
ncbi:MAG: hypothetical protein IKI25_10350 [Bacteroidales bacterium]|nr:hypothetical protein [Bacteroidales bacterium]